MLLIKGNVIMYLRKITETKPFLALTLKTRGSRGKTTKIYCFCVYALNIDIPYDGKRKSCMRAIIIKLHPSCINHKQIQRATGKTAKIHCFCVYAINIYTPCKGKGDKVLKAKQPFFLACTLKKQRVQG